MREPTYVDQLRLIENRRIGPEKTSTRATANPFDTRPNDKVGVPVLNIDRHNSNRLRHIDDGYDAPLSGELGNVFDRGLQAAVRVHMSQQHQTDIGR